MVHNQFHLELRVIFLVRVVLEFPKIVCFLSVPLVYVDIT